MGQQMMNTLVPKYANALGSSAYLVGLVGTAFGVSSLIARPFTCPAFDSFSKKKLLIFSLAGICAVFTCYGLAKSYAMLITARLFHGVFVGCVAPLTLAIAGDSLPEKSMGSGIGIFSLCQAFGQAVGPNLGLKLSKAIGFNNTFFLGAAIMAISIVLAHFVIEVPREKSPYKIALDKFIEKDSLHPAVLMFCIMIAYTCIGSYLAIFGELLGIENIGLYFTIYAIFLLVSRPVSGKLIDKYGYAKVLIPGLICFALSFVIIGTSRKLPGFLVAAVVNAFGYGVCFPAIQSLGMSCASRNRRGAAASTSFLGSDCSMLVGPALAGLLVDGIAKTNLGEIQGYSVMFCIMIIPILIGLIYFLIFKKKIQANIDKNSLTE